MQGNNFYYEVALLAHKAPLLTYHHHSQIPKNSLLIVTLRGKETRAVALKEVEKPEFTTAEIVGVVGHFTAMQATLADFIAKYYLCLVGEAFSVFAPVLDDFLPIDAPTASGTTNLNPLNKDQNACYEFIKNHQKTLIFGDTGSGKSEIYFHIIKDFIKDDGAQVLFLMPEIALTPQMTKRLKNVFGDLIDVYHSKITSKNRQRLINEVSSNNKKIIAGARSALFLPFRNLKLIIIDEEHDDAYKSANTPKYNARDLAIYLSSKFDIKLVLGSATPSLKSYANFSTTTFRLRGKFAKSTNEFIFEKTSEILTPKLQNLILQTLNNRKQFIVFVPTRANFKMLICLKCGKSVKCPFCDVNMSLHLQKNILLCHYCSFASPIPSLCPSCSTDSLSATRIGTVEVKKAIEEFLTRQNIKAKIAIFDKDHIGTQKKLECVLNEFASGDISALVGTHMLSKGHDYPNVALSVILGIDYVLNMSDYRSEEMAYSLMMQIAGRSARNSDGTVYIQSLNTEFLSLFYQDYKSFLDYEIQNRSREYPPFMRLLSLVFESINQKTAILNFKKAKSILTNSNFNIVVVANEKAGIARLHNKYRYMILLKSEDPRELLRAYSLLTLENIPCNVDMDPINLF